MLGKAPLPTSTSSTADAMRQIPMIFSSRCTRPTRKPPTTMPAAPHNM